jgi:hypothetical protein
VYGLAVLANTFGFGLVVTSSVLYFTRVVHLPVGRVGLGLTIAGLIGLAAGIPIGDLADRGRADPPLIASTVMPWKIAVAAMSIRLAISAFLWPNSWTPSSRPVARSPVKRMRRRPGPPPLPAGRR